MKKYIIDVVETYKRSVEIKAETEDEARNIERKRLIQEILIFLVMAVVTTMSTSYLQVR